MEMNTELTQSIIEASAGDPLLGTALHSAALRAGMQPWGLIQGDLHAMYDMAEGMANKATEKLRHFLKDIAQDCCDDPVIIVNTKSWKSFKSKSKRKDGPGGVHDVLRSSIIVNSKSEVHKVADKMKEKADLFEVDFKKDSNDMGYRGSYHFKIFFRGFIVEIQVLTKDLYAAKEAQHHAYEVYRELLPADYENDAEYKFLRDKVNRVFDLASEEKRKK